MDRQKLIHRLTGLLATIGMLALLITVLAQANTAQAAGRIIFVSAAAAAGGDGSSWGNAYKNLQDALAAATGGDEIWVAAGVYYPDEGGGVTDNDQTVSFELVGGVSIYGGFDGTESNRDERDWAANLAVLSGDIDQNDQNVVNGVLSSHEGITGNNSHHVVRGENLTDTVILDGFSITGGDAPVETGIVLKDWELSGGGIMLYRPNAFSLENLIIRGNRAYIYGGGFYVQRPQGQMRMRNLIVRNNLAQWGGGGGMLDNVASYSPVIQDSHILENEFRYFDRDREDCNSYILGGGGIRQVVSRITYRNVIFERNVADCEGGGLSAFQGANFINGGAFLNNRVRYIGRENSANGGGIQHLEPTADNNVTSVLFVGNSVEDSKARGGSQGGAISISWTRNPGAVFINASTFVANTSQTGSVIALNSDSTDSQAYFVAIANSIIADHGSRLFFTVPDMIQVKQSLVEGSGGSGPGWPYVGVTDLGGNIDTTPGFLQPATGSSPNVTGDFRLSLVSPAIDAGDKALDAPDPLSSADADNAGNSRVFDGEVDLGAYEAQIVCPASATTRLYVGDTATGAGTGTSWADALPRLQDALTLANICPSNSIAEVWVAQGVYYPDQGYYQADGDRAASFQLQNGLAIYGGFVGTETNLDQRDTRHYLTVLSGDIDQDDVTSGSHSITRSPADIVGANSYHVVVASGTDATAVLDGFAITGGQANGSPLAKQHEGGGLFAEAGSPTLNNLLFIGNIAEEGGAMALIAGSSPSITTAWFGSNAASDYGGALHNENSDPTLTNALMVGNRAAAGGGAIYNLASSPELINVTIAGNAAGGTVNLAGVVSPAAVQIAPVGGGIFNFLGSKPDIRNSIIWDNQDSTGIGTASASMRNLDGGSMPSADHSDIQGLSSITGLLFDGTSIDANPLFVSPVSPALAPNGRFGVYTVKRGSPVIDTGDNGFNNQPLDLGLGYLEVRPRVADGDGDGTATIDMGAYEAPLLLLGKLEVQKVASPSTASIGDAITYSYVVTNTGNVTVTVTADDDKLGAVSLTPSTLGPGASATATKVYNTTAGDLPGIVNTVDVTGTWFILPHWNEAHESATAHVDLQTSTELQVTKTASVASAEVGTNITYTYVVKAIGVDPLTNITAHDDKLGPVTLGTDSLNPANETSGTLSYIVQESDLPILNNQVTVTATVGGAVTEVEYAVVAVKVTSSPAIVLHKSADRLTAKVGDTVTYSYEVRNTGDVSLSNLVLVDSELGAIPLGVSTLAPNATQTVTGTHVVLDGDLPGPLTNTAVVTGTGPTGAVRSSQDNVSVALSNQPKLEVEKTASRSSALPGEVVTYTYTIKNTGDVSLSNVKATDTPLGTVTLSSTTLAVGASATGTLTYTVQAGDLPGPLVSTVEAEGTSPTGTVVKGTDSATVSIIASNPPAPQLGTIIIRKTTAPEGGTGFDFLSSFGTFSLDHGVSRTFTDVVPGPYSVIENASSAAGYRLSGLSCTDSVNGGVRSSGNVASRTAIINVDPGETVVCTFTNTEDDTITVEKVTIPASTASFGFGGTLGDFDLAAGSVRDFTNRQPGSYTISEDDPRPSGYVLTGIECVDSATGQTFQGDLNSRSVDLNLVAGERVHCTFTNELITSPSPDLYLPLLTVTR